MTARVGLLRGRLLPGRLLGTITPDKASATPNAAYALGRPGKPSPVPTLVIALFDNSGSVMAPAGTDPMSNRYSEVDYAFSVVARRGTRQELGAVIHFDTPSSGEVGPVPISRRGLTRLRRGLRVPPDGAGTSDLAPSLARATEMAEAHAGYEVTLVVLSDFLLTDQEPGDVLSRLAAFPGVVHAVVLGIPLSAVALDERITVTAVDRQSPPGAVARALFGSLVAHRPGSYVSESSAEDDLGSW